MCNHRMIRWCHIEGIQLVCVVEFAANIEYLSLDWLNKRYKEEGTEVVTAREDVKNFND